MGEIGDLQKTLGDVRETLGSLVGVVGAMSRNEEARDRDVSRLESEIANLRQGQAATHALVLEIQKTVGAMTQPVADFVSLRARGMYFISAIGVAISVIWGLFRDDIPAFFRRLLGIGG